MREGMTYITERCLAPLDQIIRGFEEFAGRDFEEEEGPVGCPPNPMGDECEHVKIRPGDPEDPGGVLYYHDDDLGESVELVDTGCCSCQWFMRVEGLPYYGGDCPCNKFRYCNMAIEEMRRRVKRLIHIRETTEFSVFP